MMVLPRSRVLYIAAMLVSGIVIGLIAAGRPTWQEAALPPAFWPFLISLVLDIALTQAAARGKADPLTMGDRFAGVLGAGLIVTAIIALQG